MLNVPLYFFIYLLIYSFCTFIFNRDSCRVPIFLLLFIDAVFLKAFVIQGLNLNI